MKEIIEIFNLPFGDIQEIAYEILEPMYDTTGICIFEGAAYFVAYTTYGARIEISEEDRRFLIIKELLETDLSLHEDKSLYVKG
ncbi:hypothetical protein [Oceanobacillus sp. CFH 90083]|uniref:hypothetical protein n=1 Tax=Oceanobacillus sp. CFH 90083 TaxID=2592336 RepID=UPI00128B6DD0|nr:hypothetical protein [Oceanobacillus sp. CFH 90083]